MLVKFRYTKYFQLFFSNSQHYWRRRALTALPLLREGQIGSLLVENPFCIFLFVITNEYAFLNNSLIPQMGEESQLVKCMQELF